MRKGCPVGVKAVAAVFPKDQSARVNSWLGNVDKYLTAF